MFFSKILSRLFCLGLPVLPPKPAQGFIHGSPAVGSFTEEERKEKRLSLKLQEKT